MHEGDRQGIVGRIVSAHDGNGTEGTGAAAAVSARGGVRWGAAASLLREAERAPRQRGLRRVGGGAVRAVLCRGRSSGEDLNAAGDVLPDAAGRVLRRNR